MIAEINANHWNIADKALCRDKNYTPSALEVLNGGGHVVFQAVIFTNYIQLQGEWRDEFGRGVGIRESSIEFWKTPEQERELIEGGAIKLIDRMFDYRAL